MLKEIISKFHRHHPKKRRSFRDYFSALGPGVITGSADNDPAGIVTYILAGAKTGFSTLWLMFFTLPMLTVIEEMSARVGVVTKKGLARIIKEIYGRKIALFLALILVVCNLATITADIAGVSEVLGIIFGISWKIFIFPLSLFFGYLLFTKNYHLVSRFLFLLTPFFLVYVINGFIIHPPWGEVLKNTFVPQITFDKGYLLAAMAILGTTISPYLIFWQATEEVEEKKSVKNLFEENFDVVAGMFYCNFVFYFLIISGAVVFFGKNINITTVGQAALALKPIAGPLAFALFSFGLIVSGLLAIPVLIASTAYVVAEVFESREGLDKKPKEAPLFYKVLVFCILFPLLALIINISPVEMLYYSQVLNCFLLPPLIYFLIKITDNPKIMSRYTNSKFSRLIGWATFFTSLIFSFLTLVEFLGH